jgi:hypothetical protein
MLTSPVSNRRDGLLVSPRFWAPVLVGSTPTPPTGPGRAHDVAAACRLAMAEAWVRLPLGALSIGETGTRNAEWNLSPCGAVWSARHSVKVEAEGSNPAKGAWEAA